VLLVEAAVEHTLARITLICLVDQVVVVTEEENRLKQIMQLLMVLVAEVEVI
jgi:hypothetical protein